MYWRNSLLILLFLTASCREKTETPAAAEPTAGVAEEGYANPRALVEAGELLAMAGKEHIKIIDFREREAFDLGHIPGAIPLWRSDIEDREAPVRGLIASREAMEDLLSGLGISSGDTLVIYDDRGGVNAARLWWVLQVYGFDRTRLLNGGLQQWVSQQAPMSLDYAALPAGDFKFPPAGNPGLRVEREAVLEHLDDPEWTLLDVRTDEEYSGKRQKSGAMAAGRIPGSLHIDWAEAVRYGGDMTFRPVSELKKRYARLPQDLDAPIITYCHSGVRSAHTSFVLLQLLGYKQVHNYDGSWLEWSSTEGSPVEKDSLTTILE